MTHRGPFQPLPFYDSVRYSEKHPIQREVLGAARCRPEELKGPFFFHSKLFLGSQDD